MSLQPQPPPAIPEETDRVAHAAFRKGTLCLRIADDLSGQCHAGRARGYYP
jgi:hypothetical protein